MTADLQRLDAALRALQAEASTFAWRYLNDAAARTTYVAQIASMAKQIRGDVIAGVVSAEEGCKFANTMRNVIMDETRAITSALGRAGAQATKAGGLTLQVAFDKSVDKIYPGKIFSGLSPEQKRKVFMEVIEASGRSSPKFTSQIPKWTRLGHGLVFITGAISVYNIWTDENKVRQGAIEGATLLGGALGGAAANASAGLVCGPGAPACVGALFIVGGIVGAFVASS